MAGGPVRVGPGGAEVINSPPALDAWGEVVRPIGTIDVEPVPATNSITTSFEPSGIPIVLLAPDPTPLDPNRIGWSIFNSSFIDTIFVLANPVGVVSPVFFTVKVPPQSYYEDPYHYVGQVTAIWSGANPGEALVTEYKKT